MTFLESYFPECFLNYVYLLQIVSPSELLCILNRYCIYNKKKFKELKIPSNFGETFNILEIQVLKDYVL